MARIVLSLGSNLGNRSENIDNAIDLMSMDVTVEKVSRKLPTTAILKKGAPKEWDIEFLNCVMVGETSLEPLELLVLCKKTEKQLGREFNASVWSPRIIDVDILNYGELELSTEQLTVPHKEIKNRLFLSDLNDEISDIKLTY